MLLWAAGIAHWIGGNVDFVLAGNILIGSVPGVLLGGMLAVKAPQRFLRNALAVVLIASGTALVVKEGQPEVVIPAIIVAGLMIGALFAAQIITTALPPARAPAPRRSRNSIRLPSDGLRAQPRVEELRDRVGAFMDEHVYPAEAEALRALDDEVRPGVPYPEILVEIRERAKSEGLWNLFMPDERYGAGLSNAEYGVLCEVMGRSPAVAPMAFNCSAPDTGNMEILAEHGTDEQRERWLEPLLEGEIRSCFSMTEPEVSGSTRRRCGPAPSSRTASG